jgi:hypothetical protein
MQAVSLSGLHGCATFKHSSCADALAPSQRCHGVDLISDVLHFGKLWYRGPKAITDAIDHAKFFSRSHHAVIRVYDSAGNVIETHDHAGDFKEW